MVCEAPESVLYTLLVIAGRVRDCGEQPALVELAYNIQHQSRATECRRRQGGGKADGRERNPGELGGGPHVL